MNGNFWARSRLISKAGATGNSRATLPFVASSEEGEVGPIIVEVDGSRSRRQSAKVWLLSKASTSKGSHPP
jgi:hypothetical protein